MWTMRFKNISQSPMVGSWGFPDTVPCYKGLPLFPEPHIYELASPDYEIAKDEEPRLFKIMWGYLQDKKAAT